MSRHLSSCRPWLSDGRRVLRHLLTPRVVAWIACDLQQPYTLPTVPATYEPGDSLGRRRCSRSGGSRTAWSPRLGGAMTFTRPPKTGELRLFVDQENVTGSSGGTTASREGSVFVTVASQPERRPRPAARSLRRGRTEARLALQSVPRRLTSQPIARAPAVRRGQSKEGVDT